MICEKSAIISWASVVRDVSEVVVDETAQYAGYLFMNDNNTTHDESKSSSDYKPPNLVQVNESNSFLDKPSKFQLNWR